MRPEAAGVVRADRGTASTVVEHPRQGDRALVMRAVVAGAARGPGTTPTGAGQRTRCERAPVLSVDAAGVAGGAAGWRRAQLRAWSSNRGIARRTRWAALAVCVVAAGGCARSVAPDPGLEGLAVTQLAPTSLVPGTRLIVTGASFVAEPWGQATLHLEGRAGERAIDATWPATFVDYTTLTVAIDAGRLAALGGDGGFHGTATVEVVSATDHQTYRAAPLAVDLALHTRLAPSATGIVAGGVIFINDALEVGGDGFLLGGDEGTTVAQVAGCFTRDTGGGCQPVPAIELPLTPRGSRTTGSFAFSPRVAGIRPGAFTGTITLVNQQPGADAASAAPLDVAYQLVSPQVFSVDPPAASLGQYVFVHGGGFVGGEPGAATELELTGSFTRTGAAPAAMALTLIPELINGRLVRYVISSDDELGRSLDLRTETGAFAGTMSPVVSYGGDRVRGPATQVAFAIAPIKQVVYLAFQPSYVEELRDFGLRAVDRQLRERVVAACREVYRGVNLEVRLEPPTDFAQFETVELVGVDPNDQGLFGYDNSPGKDSGNLRLYDRIGGVNALTQEDGSPGYGGVFLRSLMAFSQHPGSFARPASSADPAFDQVFDPLRPDRGGEPVSSADLAGGLSPLTDGAGCPGGDRAHQIRCAIFVLGNLIGGTLAHEVGHSLGLANPYQDGFHDRGDAPNRLMDAGDARPFLERASLAGQGPGVFCDEEYAYLRIILATPEPAYQIARPRCN